MDTFAKSNLKRKLRSGSGIRQRIRTNKISLRTNIVLFIFSHRKKILVWFQCNQVDLTTKGFDNKNNNSHNKADDLGIITKMRWFWYDCHVKWGLRVMSSYFKAQTCFSLFPQNCTLFDRVWEYSYWCNYAYYGIVASFSWIIQCAFRTVPT